MLYVKVAKNCVNTKMHHQEVSKEKFEEMIMNSYAKQEWDDRHSDLIDDNGDLTKEFFEKENKWYENALEEAKKYGFDFGDYYLYILDDNKDMYEIERLDC